MDESQLVIVLIGLLDAGIAAFNANPFNAARPLPAGLESVRAFQPRQQGAEIVPTIYVNHAGTKPIGFPKRTAKWDTSTLEMVNTQGNRYESTYHIEALIPQSPADPTAMTESDVLNIARFILQSDSTLATLVPQNIGVLRVTELQANWIVDDKGQNENVPFFEVTFSHRLEFSSTVPTIDVFETVFNRV